MHPPDSIHVAAKPIVVDSCNNCCCPIFFRRTPRATVTSPVIPPAPHNSPDVVETAEKISAMRVDTWELPPVAPHHIFSGKPLHVPTQQHQDTMFEPVPIAPRRTSEMVLKDEFKPPELKTQ